MKQGVGCTQLCQKCFKKGHWTFECKNQKAYLYRPSRTAQIKQPELIPKSNFDAGGFEKTKKEGGRGAAVHDGDWKRSTLRKVDSSSSSSSDSSNNQEQKGLQEQLMSLIEKVKKKKLKKSKKDKKKSSSSGSSSSSSSDKSRKPK